MTCDAAYESPSGEQLALKLGWFSLALGFAELAAPRAVAGLIGVPPDAPTLSVLRSYGVREMSNGLAILAQPDRARWLWSRVAGDTLDLATLASAMSSPRTDRNRAIFATGAVAARTALDVWCAQQLSQQEHALRGATTPSPSRFGGENGPPAKNVRIAEAVTINQPIERIEELWANLGMLPPSLRNLSETVESMRARVHFLPAPGARGTEVHVELKYEPSTSIIRNTIAKLFGQDPASQIREDLRRFKQVMETGEIPLSEGPSLWRPAQPAADPQEVRTAAGVGVQR